MSLSAHNFLNSGYFHKIFGKYFQKSSFYFKVFTAAFIFLELQPISWWANSFLKLTLKHTSKYNSWEDLQRYKLKRRSNFNPIKFSALFHWKGIYKNVYKGLHKETENNWNSRSSRPGVFCKKSFLRNLAKFTGKHLRQSLFFNEVAGLIKLDA